MTEEVKMITKVLSESRWVDFAYLFGSRVRGTAGERSDWDIGVYFNKNPDRIPGWIVFELQADISSKIKEQTQVIPLNNLDSPVFAFQIINNALLLIDKVPEKRVSYEARILRRYHDWQYFLTRHMAA